MLVKTAIRPCELGVRLIRNICLYWQLEQSQTANESCERTSAAFPPEPSKSSYVRDPLCRIGHSALFPKSSHALVGNSTTWLFQRSFVTFRQVLLRTNRSWVPSRRPYAGQASLHTDRYFFFFGLNVIFFNNMISACTAGRIQTRFKLRLCHLKRFLAGTVWSNSKRQQNFNDSS